MRSLALGFVQLAHVDLVDRRVRAQFEARAFSRLQMLQPLRSLFTHRALLWKALGVLRSGAQGKGVVHGSLTLFLDNGGHVQCVSILVTLPHDGAVMEGYLKFSYPKAGNSKYLLGSTEEYMVIYPDTKQLENILENPCQLGRAAQIPLEF